MSCILPTNTLSSSTLIDVHPQWSSGTHRSYLPSSIYSVCLRTHRLLWDQNQSCYRTGQRNIHIRIRQILRCLLIFLPCLYHEHKSSCRSETKMQQTLFNRGKQRRKKLGDYSQYSIPDLSTSSLQSCARPPVTNQHETDSGSTSSQVDLCISFCPNSCLRQ